MTGGYLTRHKAEFLKAWLATFPMNMSTYLTAHAINTYDFWAVAPWMIYGNQTIYAGAITKEQLNVKDIVKELNIYLPSDKIFDRATSETIAKFMSTHIVYLNAGSCAFIMLFVMALILQLGKERCVIPLLPAFLSWLTILVASPIAFAFRYVLYLAFLMPFIISLPFMTDEENVEDNCHE